MHLPAAPVLKAVLGTVTFLWFAVHLMFAAVGVLAFLIFPDGGVHLWPTILGPFLLFLSTVGFLFLVELKISRLRVFLANLGFSRRRLLVIALLWVGILEAVIAGVLLFLPGIRIVGS